jgi:uncharacterized repeat protein (TIGR04076 family)
MSPLKITVLRRMSNPDLAMAYLGAEFPLPCPLFVEGQEYIAQNDLRPDGFCEWAWRDILPKAELSRTREDRTMIACCTDGLSPWCLSSSTWATETIFGPQSKHKEMNLCLLLKSPYSKQ